MATRLSFSQYGASDWEPIDLYENESAYRTFWAAVLQFATAAKAQEVRYDSSAGEDCLSIVVGSEVRFMQPPPQDLRSQLLSAGKRLGFGRFWYWLKLLLGKRHGTLVVELPDDQIAWTVELGKSALVLRRST